MAIYSDPPTANNFDPPSGAFRAMRPYPSRRFLTPATGGTFEGVGCDSQDQGTTQRGSRTEHPVDCPRAGHPNLSAVKVLRKLKERHPELGVSDRSARRYIKVLKETVSLRQKRYYEPVESLPGVQCQVDGGELRGVLLGGEAATVHFVVFVLSYSRLMYAGLSLIRPIDTATFIPSSGNRGRRSGKIPLPDFLEIGSGSVHSVFMVVT